MKPIATRSLGGTRPFRPRTEAGRSIGPDARSAPVAEKERRRKSRRVSAWWAAGIFVAATKGELAFITRRQFASRGPKLQSAKRVRRGVRRFAKNESQPAPGSERQSELENPRLKFGLKAGHRETRVNAELQAP